VKKLPPEEAIRASIRDLTERTRQLRVELEEMVRPRPSSPGAFSHDRPLRRTLPASSRRRKP
jgi:hypothetical protein